MRKNKISLLLACIVISLCQQSRAQVSITTTGSYSQDYDALPASGSATWTNNSTIASWYHARTGTGTTIVANNGSSNAGNLYSYGTGTNTERALGSLGSGNAAVGNLFWGVRLVNNSGAVLNSITVSYRGEQWRNSAAAAQTAAFSYLVGAPTVTGSLAEFQSAGVAVTQLDFTSPVTGGTAGALDGNLAANFVNITHTITGMSIPNGSEFMLRWSDPDHGGADHGLSIDDLTISWTTSGGLNLSINDVSATEGNAGTTNFTFTVSLSSPAPVGGVTFDIGTADNSATLADNDYVLNSLTSQTITSGNSTYLFTVQVNGDPTVEPNETFFVNVSNVTGATVGDAQGLGTITNDDVSLVPIHTIQGNGNSSPFTGVSVTTSGIVTGLRSNGFFLQEPDATVDADPNTSEGIFVFTSGAPPAAAAVGNSVQVAGTVAEFIPAADPNSPSQTELISPTVVLLSTGNPLPAAIVLVAGDTDPAGTIYQLEKFEGMRVQVNSLTVVAPTQGNKNEAAATSTTNGFFYGVITGIPRPFREPGIEAPDPPPSGSIPPIPRYDGNPELIGIGSNSIGSAAIDAATGAVLTNVVGPLDYRSRTYTIDIDPASPPTVSNNGLTFTAVPLQTVDELTVASFNVERFYDDVNDAGGDAVLTTTAYNNRLNKVSLAIRNVLRTPDIIGFVEVENLTVLQAIANKVNNDVVAGGGANPNYTAYLVDGNDVGLIDVGFLVKPARVNISSVVQYGAATTYINPNNGLPELLNDRPPLVLNGTFTGSPCNSGNAITVIVNHLRSLIGIDDPADGNRVRTKRAKQAEFLADLIQTFQTADPTANIISVGDYNAYQFNDGYVDLIGTIKGTPTPPANVVLASPDLVNPDLINLIDTYTASERYSYSFGGDAQVLDHIIVNPNLLSKISRFSIARVDADFPEVYRSDANRPERISDHDAPVAYILFPNNTTATCPANITQSNDPNQCAAVVNYAAPTTSGSCGPITTIPASGSTFPVGTTTVNVYNNTCGQLYVVSTNVLVRFDASTPNIIIPVPITGLLAGENIRGIDFRPATGQLYGIAVNGTTAHLYTINTSTGAATQVGGDITVSGTAFGFDFNPTVDRIRVVSNTGMNIRLNPNTGALAGVDTNINPPALSVTGSGYTNNFLGATLTTLYGIDAVNDQLVLQGGINGVPSPNTGTLTPVGPLGLDASDVNGFDISPCGGIAYASLQTGGPLLSRLYTINLSTGAATLVGAIGGGQPVDGLAVSMIQGSQACSFTVTVNDTQPPVITCPSNISGLCGSQVVNYPAPSINDNCPAVTVVATPASGTVFPVGTTTVTATATDGAGNTATCTFTVTIDPPPTAVATPSSQTRCSGVAIATIVLSSSTPGTTYAWTRDNVATVTGIAASGSGNISGTLTNTTTAPITVTFTITPTAGVCTGPTTTATVLVNPTPNAVAAPPSQTICSGTAITAIALSGNVAGTTYTWTRTNTVNITGMGASGSGNPITGTLTNNTNTIQTTTFTITPTANGCAGPSTTATVTVNPMPTVTQPMIQVIITGNGGFADEITWTLSNSLPAVILSGGPYGFNPPATPSALVPATNAPFEFFIEAQGFFNDNSALWEVRCNGAVVASGCIQGTNNGGPCANIGSLTVSGIPGCDPLAPQTICSGSAIAPITLTGPVAGTVFNWTRDNTVNVTGIAASGTGTISGTLTNTTNVPQVVVFTITPSANGCNGTPVTATITVNPIPNAVATPSSQTICSGVAITPIALTGNVAGTVYSWTRNNTANVTGIPANGTGNISGTLTNTTTSLQTTTFTITPSYTNAGVTCTGTPITATVSVQAPLILTCPANITVNAAPGTCAATVTYAATVTGTPAPTVTYVPASGSSFPVGTTTVTVTATNICATVTCTFTVTVLDVQIPVISVQPLSQSKCVGDNVTFTVVSTFASSYQWQTFTGGVWVNIPGTNAPSYSLSNVTLAMNTNSYRVLITGPCGTVTASNHAVLNVYPIPVVVISASIPPILLPTDVLTLTANTLPPPQPGGTFVWRKNGNIIAGATGPTLGPLTVNDVGSYTVTYTVNGCSGTSAALVVSAKQSDHFYVYPNPNFGQFQVRFFNQVNEQVTVTVYDSKGSQVYQRKITTTTPYTSLDVNLGNNPQGSYLVVVHNSANQVVGSQWVVVFH